MYLRSILNTAALFTLTACAGPVAPEATPQATVTATVTATPSAAEIEYGLGDDNKSITAPVITDVEELRLTLVDAGLVCDGWQVTVEGVSGECDGGTMLNAYPDSDEGKEVHRSAVALSFLALDAQDRPDVALLVGPTWFVRADTAGAYELRDLIGGTVVGIVG